MSRLETELVRELFSESEDLVERSRPTRLGALRERIARGEYRPNLMLIAERMLDAKA